jgi:predicted Zn-dependent protease
MKKILFVLIIFYTYSFADQLPDLGSTSDNIINKVHEKKIRHQILSQAYSSKLVEQDPELIFYINNLGSRLLKVVPELSNNNTTFFTIKDPTVNAFAMLGGIIGIHTGLLYAANSESELASVLAHEIAHLSQKHLPRIIEAQSKDTFKTSLAMVFALLLTRSNAQMANAAIQTATASAVQNTLDFTREHEKEADREGLLILNRAGFDERGAISFFKTLDKANQFSVGAAPYFLRTHPVTLDRISDIEDRLKDFPFRQVSENPSFKFVKAKMKAFSGEPSDMVNIFTKNISNKSYSNESAENFSLAYAYLRNNQIDKAREILNKIIHLKKTSPTIVELEANILKREGKFQIVQSLYEKALFKIPNYQAYIYGLADVYIIMNDLDKAMNLIEKALLIYPSDSNLYKLLAKVHKKQKALYLEYKNLGEYFYFSFDLKESANQMSLAINAPDANFYDKSKAEQRLKEIKAEMAMYENIK